MIFCLFHFLSYVIGVGFYWETEKINKQINKGKKKKRETFLVFEIWLKNEEETSDEVEENYIVIILSFDNSESNKTINWVYLWSSLVTQVD